MLNCFLINSPALNPLKLKNLSTDFEYYNYYRCYVPNLWLAFKRGGNPEFLKFIDSCKFWTFILKSTFFERKWVTEIIFVSNFTKKADFLRKLQKTNFFDSKFSNKLQKTNKQTNKQKTKKKTKNFSVKNAQITMLRRMSKNGGFFFSPNLIFFKGQNVIFSCNDSENVRLGEKQK